jgi:hypothetical protein
MNVAVVHIVRSQCLEAAVQDSQYLWQDLPSVVFKESFPSKQECVCVCYICLWSSPWMEIIANSPSRTACLAITVIYQMACILARDRSPLWLCPYEIVALTSKDYTASLGDFSWSTKFLHGRLYRRQGLFRRKHWCILHDVLPSSNKRLTQWQRFVEYASPFDSY